MNTGASNRKVLLAIVTLTALVVWGTFAYRLTGGLQDREPSQGSVSEVAGRSAPRTTRAPTLHFEGGLRNPFQRPAGLSPAETSASFGHRQTPPSSRRASALPPLTLEGIVGGVVMVHGSRKGVRLARRGDTLEGGRRVAQVASAWIVLRRGAQSDTLRLSPTPPR